MKSKLQTLRMMFYAPLIAGAFRVLVTVVILIWNPQNMSFRFFQVLPMLVVLVYSFMYFKLYNDGDPVITLMLPTIVHFLAILLFKRQLEIIPFIIPVLFDIVYLTVKGVKGSMFPFEFEGDDELDDLSGFEESEFNSPEEEQPASPT